MSKLRKYTYEKFKEAVANSTSIRQTLQKLGVKPQGGNYRVFKRLSEKFNIDTSHFKGQAWSKDKLIGPKRKLEDYLSNKIPIGSNKLKNKLLKAGIFIHQCQCCLHKTWNKVLIPLELHHINGNHNDNSLTNLQLLCPNCHALTSTYRGKNISIS